MIAKYISLGICFFLFCNSFAQQQTGAGDSVAMIMGRVKETLVKHSNPRLPVQNRQPLVDARFEPIKFDGCDLHWRLVAPLDKLKRRSLVIHGKRAARYNLGRANNSLDASGTSGLVIDNLSVT